MGQNNDAELSVACLKSSRARSYNDAINNQQTHLCPSCLGSPTVHSLYPTSLASMRVAGLMAIRKDKGSAMAQMPTRPSFATSQLIGNGDKKQ